MASWVVSFAGNANRCRSMRCSGTKPGGSELGGVKKMTYCVEFAWLVNRAAIFASIKSDDVKEEDEGKGGVELADFRVLRERHRVTDQVLQEDLDALHSSPASQPPDDRLRDPLDVVSEDLAMGLKGKMVRKVEIKSDGDMFLENFRYNPQHFSHMSPGNIRNVDFPQGDCGTVGSVIV
ncbi:hypothetical protein RHGRI_026697 [Rhododendron griersonianum]|uniref:Uncharacterized protein n=1 Tax=Rhododendron griersonianum TaxID=479676 RepID=A0AAV6IUU2_9ERIC|nr:hypothetical protein RHGRI_026697 [Rhododendron griersonianum]